MAGVGRGMLRSSEPKEASMHLTRKDLVATLSAIGVTLVTMAVLGEWGWPLLGGVRAGAAAVLLVGMGMCAVGNAVAGEAPSMRDPYVRFMAAVGVAILVAAIVAIVTGAEAWLVVETGLILAMWLVSTVRHAFVATPHAAASV
jgi:hypothetical protein